ncbi:sugar ABC transporter permease [Paenibacillus hemerocallicola]|uniref:Sugar ABC transporter permease n=1 Tax=Paenibacillus hemerocallicola TaxID=1172614 RepID=A0A5C4T0Q7_9BACL|nr:ABC transporter permease subunit [Paenibacillus hemerocallicola]TNJ62688.1 sugar ABC transporter permease [Paenibacillus hemerocallicola]
MLILPVLIYYVVFHYVPMYGIIIAFKKFQPLKGILGSSWVGFRYFEEFFTAPYFWRLLKNTLLLSFYSLVWGFPAPVIFALLLNEVRHKLYKRLVQTVSYLPHFISIVVIAGMVVSFTGLREGIVNQALVLIGMEPINFMAEPGWFRTIFVGSGIWQGFGWGSIIYLAAIAGIDPQLYEAAEMDGAGRWTRMWHITIPSLIPTIVIMFIMQMGHLMDIGVEKVLLLSNPLTYETADVISTFVYRRGVLNQDYSFATAVGLFNNVINLILLISVNALSRRLSQSSLW